MPDYTSFCLRQCCVNPLSLSYSRHVNVPVAQRTNIYSNLIYIKSLALDEAFPEPNVKFTVLFLYYLLMDQINFYKYSVSRRNWFDVMFGAFLYMAQRPGH